MRMSLAFKLFTVAEYYKMHEVGILRDDERLELIEGEIALEVHRDTGPDGYRDVRRLRRGDQVSPLAFPDLVLDVESLLGPEPS